MNEKIVTILLGLGIGIILAVAILFGPRIAGNFSLPKSSPQTLPISPSTPPTTPTAQTTLTIDTPTDNFWATESPITVSGKTSANVLVTLISPADEVATQSASNGLFSASLKIEEGENTIVAIVRDSSGKFQTAKKSVTLEIKSE